MLTLSILLLLLVYLYHETTSTVVERVEIITGFNPDRTIHILHLSDLHFRRWGRVEKRVLSYVHRIKPPLILLTGDYVNNRKNKKEWMAFLEKLTENSSVYAVRGNHDYDDLDIERTFSKLGITLLCNKGVSLQLEGLPLNIIGVESLDRRYTCLREVASTLKLNDSYNIVLSHTYHCIKRGKGMGIHLYLVGDTHGGQIYFPYITQKLLQHRHEVEYMRGKYSVNGSILYVNRGLGWILLPIRLRSRPEMTLLQLK